MTFYKAYLCVGFGPLIVRVQGCCYLMVCPYLSCFTNFVSYFTIYKRKKIK